MTPGSQLGLGLLDESTLRNAAANDVWKRKEVDLLLELYLVGTEMVRIAATLQRNRKAIVRKLQEYIYNERDRVTNYQPIHRTSRTGKRITPNEQQIIKECRKKRVPWEKIALLLCRKVTDIDADNRKVIEPHLIASMKQAATGVDLVLAYRYLYYVHARPIVSDYAYDQIEKEEIEYGGGKGVLDKFVGSDRAEDYPPHIRALALYLAFKYSGREHKPAK